MNNASDDAASMSGRREETEAKLLTALALKVNAGEKVSISAVARAAGVSPSLVHTKYPAIAANIRAKMGVQKRDDIESLRARLLEQEGANRLLRDEVSQLRRQLAAVASINATLMHECAVLRASNEGKVYLLAHERPQ